MISVQTSTSHERKHAIVVQVSPQKQGAHVEAWSFDFVLLSCKTVAAPLGSCCKRNNSGQKSRHEIIMRSRRIQGSGPRAGWVIFRGRCRQKATSAACRSQSQCSSLKGHESFAEKKMSRWSGDGRKMDESVAELILVAECT